MLIDKARIEPIISWFVTVHPHETSALIHSTSSFFFILSAYFVVLPLRDEGAISLGLGNLPGLFVGSLLLTLVAAPVSTLIFSLPNLSKGKALVLIHRFFSLSLVVFFILWLFSTPGSSPFSFKGMLLVNSNIKEELKVTVTESIPASSASWERQGWFYITVRISLFLWVALLNLITISSTWARIIDVMDNESGSRLFGFIGAGATLGQLFGSLFATGMAWLGPYLLLFAALLLELAAQSSKGIDKHISQNPEELFPIRNADTDDIIENRDQSESNFKASSPRSSNSAARPQIWPILEGLQLVLSSSYLLQVALFLWLSAVVSSFFYFQKVTVIASAVTTPVGRRRLLAQINSFIAVFILAGQLTLTVWIDPEFNVFGHKSVLSSRNPLHLISRLILRWIYAGTFALFYSIPSVLFAFICPLEATIFFGYIYLFLLQGRILTVAGVTTAICSSPVVGFVNLIALAVWPSWIAVAISETSRKVITYVVTRPGRELLFTVVSQDEKYKAKVCIDVIVQRLGDATAAGMYKLLFTTLHGKVSTVSLCALPACCIWIVTAYHLGRQQTRLAKYRASPPPEPS